MVVRVARFISRYLLIFVFATALALLQLALRLCVRLRIGTLAVGDILSDGVAGVDVLNRVSRRHSGRTPQGLGALDRPRW